MKGATLKHLLKRETRPTYRPIGYRVHFGQLGLVAG